jgi:signal peptidase II
MSPAGGPETEPSSSPSSVPGHSPSQRRRSPGRAVLFLAIAGGVIALDQWSKSWALRSLGFTGRRHVIGPVNFVLTFNRGAAFSLGSGATPVIEAVAIGLIVVVLAFSRRLALGGTSPAVIVGLGLLFGGALSNLADRFFRHHGGAVVDFIQAVRWWPTFNVADAAVTCGAIVAAVALLFSSGDKGRDRDSSEGPGDGSPPGGTGSDRRPLVVAEKGPVAPPIAEGRRLSPPEGR